MLEIVEYISNSLLDVFSMDMAYFERSVPVSQDIFKIMLVVGWALLLGNLVFQAMRGMAAGLGFESEDPKILFARTFIFSFLLLVSNQICSIGFGMTATVINMLQVPSSVQIPMPSETAFTIGASWLLVVIIGFVVMWQVVRLFFEVGERYVVTAVLALLSPLAFAMGGSKSTEDIFKGWVRMFGSMCLMMVFNVIFLKMLISVLAAMPDGSGVLPWMILVMGIARVARKIDSIIARIGLNPAITGEGLGRGGLPGMLALTVARSLGSTVAKSIGKNGGGRAAGTGTAGKKPPGPPSGGTGRTAPPGTGGGGRAGRANSGQAAAGGAAHAAQGQQTATQTASATSAQSATSQSTSAGTRTATQSATASVHTAQTAGTSAPQGAAVHTAGQASVGQTGAKTGFTAASVGRQGANRFTMHLGASHSPSAAGAVGTAGTAEPSQSRKVQGVAQGAPTAQRPPSTQPQAKGQAPTPGMAGKPDAAKVGGTRLTTVPPSARQEGRGTTTQATGGQTTQRQSSVSTQQSRTERTHAASGTSPAAAQTRMQADRPPSPGTAGTAAGSPATSRPPQGAGATPGAGRNGAQPSQARPPSTTQSPSRSTPAQHTASATSPRPVQQESRPTTPTAAPTQAQRPLTSTAGSAPAPTRPDRAVQGAKPPVSTPSGQSKAPRPPAVAQSKPQGHGKPTGKTNPTPPKQNIKPRKGGGSHG